VEHTFTWTGNYRRFLVRHKRLLSVTAGFLTLAHIMICLRMLLK